MCLCLCCLKLNTILILNGSIGMKDIKKSTTCLKSSKIQNYGTAKNNSQDK